MRYHRRHPGHRLGHVDDHINDAIRADRWAHITASAPAGVRGKGKVVGSAVLKVLGSGTATVTWKANGGPAHVERDVPLPWEHSIDVVEEAPSEVRADGAASGCTITMGDMLVSFKNEPNPVCEFAYWG